MRYFAVLAVVMMGVLSGGCRSGVPARLDGGVADFGKFNETPKPRMGGLPWPGIFSAFEVTDAQHLGNHAYDGEWGEAEQIRGIIYTTRGGFIDVAHARKSIDLCKFIQVRAEAALLNDWEGFQYKSLEPSVFVVRLTYPPFWKTLPPEERQAVAKELSIRMAQRLAMVTISWHEILTWFGYQSTPIVSEWNSAFTWDDTGAHAFGVLVGGRALRANMEWDRAATEQIQVTLKELGAVDAQRTIAAVERVRGRWWNDAGPLKRQVEVGLDRPVDAWIVAGLPFAEGAAVRYELPGMSGVMGRNYSGMVGVEIDANVEQEGRMKGIIGRGGRIDLAGVGKLVGYIREWHVAREGPRSITPE